jgi:hypothetical protein
MGFVYEFERCLVEGIVPNLGEKSFVRFCLRRGARLAVSSFGSERILELEAR